MTVSLSTKILTLAIAPLVHFIYYALRIWYAARSVHLTVPSWRRGYRYTHLSEHSWQGLNPLCVIILVLLGNASKNQDCKITASLLVLLVQTFDNIIEEKHKQEIQLWYPLSDKVVLYNSKSFLGFNKCLCNNLLTSIYNFWVRLLKLLLYLVCKKMTWNYFKSPLIHE